MTLLYCPRCEKPLDPEHDAKACAALVQKKISRRFFFGIAFGGLAAAVAAKTGAAINLAPTLDEINIVTLSLVPKLTDQIFKVSPLFFRLKEQDYRLYYNNGPIKP